MIRSDPAECAMESRIAHEWEILGTLFYSVCFPFYLYLYATIQLYPSLSNSSSAHLRPAHLRPIDLSIHLSIHLSFCVSSYLSAYLSTCLFSVSRSSCVLSECRVSYTVAPEVCHSIDSGPIQLLMEQYDFFDKFLFFWCHMVAC